MRRWTNVLMVAWAAVASVSPLKAQDGPNQSTGWDREKAVQYLDERMDLWFAKAAKLRTGDTPLFAIA